MNGHTQNSDLTLWEYALRVYAAPDVAQACLQAQDVFGVDVNLLLCAAWCAERGRRLERGAIAALDEHCRSWREQVIVPLRRQRRLWRDDPERAGDYAAAKRLELAAEQEQLQRLEQRVEDASGEPEASLLGSNLAQVFDYFGASTRAAQRLCDAVLAARQSAARNPPD